ncbi:MAG TPA: protein translocase subunit SecDF [Bacteroidia bacterium]|jgi:SecD/SecF fusion protein|nr:protein translocase subunit SecDF [Bacteroidia bacterium]
MQNKGAITTFAVLLGLACIFYLSFTWVTRGIEKDAMAYGDAYITNPFVIKTAADKAKGDAAKQRVYLDSVKNIKIDSYLDSLKSLPVYDIILTKYTYDECKQKEINLGLDLRGGMNVTLEVSVAEIIKSLSNNNPDPDFNKAISEAQKNLGVGNNKSFVTLFSEAYKKIKPDGRLAPIFQTIENKGKIDYNDPNDKVIAFINLRVDDAVSNSEKTFRSRIDRFGVAQPNIQKLEASGRILIELPGVKDKERVRKLLQGTANLEFWETYENAELGQYWVEANKRVKALLRPDLAKLDSIKNADSAKVALGDSTAKAAAKKLTPGEIAKAKADSIAKIKADSTTAEGKSLEEKLKGNTASKADSNKGKGAKNDTSLTNYKLNNPLYSMAGPLVPNVSQDGKYFGFGSAVGYALVKDTATINAWLSNPRVRSVFPSKVRFMWESKPGKGSNALMLHAIKVTDRNGKAAMYGDIIDEARKDFQQQTGEIAISMTMKGEASQKWRQLTKNNAPKAAKERGRCVAIVMDNLVYSSPTVNGEIPTGNSQITGNFDNREADALVAILSAGKLPAPARIVEETIVGPTLGAEAISNGLMSFVIAFIVILIFMAMYYNKAGLVANVALCINLFFIMGILTSLGATLTLPGIAGIVLTIGLSVDANILIFERIREELSLGKSIAQAIKEGFKHAMSSIIDSNVTLLILGLILYVFGNGPVQGFATTLCIGILSSLFAAVVLSRVIFDWLINKKKNITFDNNMTRNAFKSLHFDFVKRRKVYYTISTLIIALGVVFYFKNGGFNLGVDFQGGRTYIYGFEKAMNTDDVKLALKKEIGETEVKTAGSESKIKITTKYRINENNMEVDQEVEKAIDKGLGTLNTKFEVLSSQKVGPTIATDIVYSAYGAVLFSCLLMFIYIVVRFKKWQYGLGAVVALFHDVLVVLACYTIFDKMLPFSLEIGQDFIAAILTVMGYTMTETVVVFDRIREKLAESGKSDVYGEERNKLINFALNSTLSRTILTSLTVFFVLLVIFIFGGDAIRGFIFALLIGRVIGTYSSLCISTPIVVDFDKKKK